MYGDLVYATPGLTAAAIDHYFKDGSFGVQAGQVERTYSPRAGRHDRPRRGLRRPAHLRRHALRHDVRRGLRRRRGPPVLHGRAAPRRPRAAVRASPAASNKAMDAEVWDNAPYTEADLQRADRPGRRRLRRRGRRSSQQDLDDYVAGINQYITEAPLDPTKMPAEYAAIGKPLEAWKATDVIATASLIGGIFGKGGGGELGNALVLDGGQGPLRRRRRARRCGATSGARTTPRRRPRSERPRASPTRTGRGGQPDAVAIPDRGRARGRRPTTTLHPAGRPAPSGILDGLGSLPAGSNALLVSGREVGVGPSARRLRPAGRATSCRRS